jgi:hypothetical protein
MLVSSTRLGEGGDEATEDVELLDEDMVDGDEELDQLRLR